MARNLGFRQFAPIEEKLDLTGAWLLCEDTGIENNAEGPPTFSDLLKETDWF